MPAAHPEVPRVVSLGGGTGQSTLLRGLKNHRAELSALVAVTDDGGSSGRLRQELGVLPPGDIRNCMLALSEDEALMSKLFRHRFDSSGGLNGHSFGNLFVTAMAEVSGDFVEAIRLTSEVLAIKGRIYPVTSSDVRLRAQLDDGTWIHGETRITAEGRRIRRVELSPPNAEALPDALEAIRSADVIALGPGSLYTSVIAALLPGKMIEAIQASRARKIYIQNIMSQPSETVGLTMSDHIEAIFDQCGGPLFDTALVNTRMPSDAILRKYEQDNAGVVEIDRPRVETLGVRIIERDLLAEQETVRHDPGALADAVLNI